MKNFRVYEHVYGLPDYLDRPHEEIEECILNDCCSSSQAEKYIDNINAMQQTDKNGRKRHLYIVWDN